MGGLRGEAGGREEGRGRWLKTQIQVIENDPEKYSHAEKDQTSPQCLVDVYQCTGQISGSSHPNGASCWQHLLRHNFTGTTVVRKSRLASPEHCGYVGTYLMSVAMSVYAI